MSLAAVSDAQIDKFSNKAQAIERAVGEVIVGQKDVVRQTLVALLAGGHVLLEGLPGLGKTVLVKTLGQVLSLDFSRVQFTPDLMPADIVGTEVLTEDGGRRGFQFRAGPVFCNLLLADEINRATPKTQSALLEAMSERTVTVGGETRPLPSPFFVLATQNPVEQEGTYPLPEAQMDRFLLKILVPFPTPEELAGILDRTTTNKAVELTAVATGDEVREMQLVAREVPLATPVARYAVNLIMATHPNQPGAPERVRKYVRYGASPRGLQSLVLSSKVRALLEGRYNVAFDDLRAMAAPVLRHRLLLNFEAQAEGIQADDIVHDIVDHVKPGEPA